MITMKKNFGVAMEKQNLITIASKNNYDQKKWEEKINMGDDNYGEK